MQILLANLDFTLMNQNKFFQFIEKQCEVTVKTIFLNKRNKKKDKDTKASWVHRPNLEDQINRKPKDQL